MAGHTADHIHRRSGGSNSEAQWRVTLGISFIGDLEGQTQRRNGGSPGAGDHIHRRSGGSNSEAQWRVTLRITFIGDLRVKLRGAMAGHPGDHIHRRSGGSNSEAQWRVTLLEGQTQRRIGGSPWGSQS